MKEIPFRHQVSRAIKRTMLSILIRSPEMFRDYRKELRPEHFSVADTVLAAIWRAVLEYYQRHQQLPPRGHLEAKARAAIAAVPDYRAAQADLEDFLDEAFRNIDPKEILAQLDAYRTWVVKAIKHLREEHVVQEMAESTTSEGRSVADPPGYLEQARRAVEEIAMIGEPKPELFLPEGWTEEMNLGVFSTGLSFLDGFLDGGHAPGEVYALLGTYGSGKTTLATMLAVEAARQAHDAERTGGKAHELAFFVSYEARIKEMRIRAMSYAAKISHYSLREMGRRGLKALSTADNLRPYEEKMFHEALLAGKRVLGEQERAQRATKWLTRHFACVDMTGHGQHYCGAGSGYIPEIAERIKSQLRRRGNGARARVIVVDYVGAMAKRYLAATNKDENALRHVVADAPLMAANMLASEFGCPVWLVHQLSGEANRRAPGSKYHHTDAAEARNFGENVDFAFIIGSSNQLDLRQLACTKHRRTSARAATVLRMHLDGGSLEHVGDKYVIDSSTKTIKDL